MRSRSMLPLAFAVAALCGAGSAAAGTVSRLTPPSELFASGNPQPPVIARFLPGQRFDLQATLRPDAGTTITDFRFFVDGVDTLTPIYIGTKPIPNPAVHNLGMVKETGDAALCMDAANKNTGKAGCKLVAGLPANSAVVSQRAYYNFSAGMHTFSVVATQSDGAHLSAVRTYRRCWR